MLIKDWKKALRTHSVQLSALGATAASAWLTLTEAQQQGVLSFLHINRPGTLVVVGFLAVIVGRLKAQPKLHNGDTE